MTDTVHLGYAVGTGEAVTIPLRHMVVTGQTQEAGKTTTLEALIARANLPAVAFVTKRGERSFSEGRRIQPYFRERADWQFVASVLEATMRERLKFERAWIMRASKGARTLADVHRNVKAAMEKAKGMSADVYLTLDAYLEIVVPRVASIRWATSLELENGINVLDVSHRDRFPPELQGLVMRSALEWVYEKCDGTVTIIPEAWEFCPQGRGSPVKLAAVELIRKGAGLHNYVWLDSQDIGGVDKELLRSCPVWLLGVQREANEIKRVLDSIPAGVSKPKPTDVALLEKGQFFACYGRHVIKTYVQPAWMLEQHAHLIARGEMHPEYVRPPAPIPDSSIPKGVLVYEPPPQLIEEDYLMSNEAAQKLDRIIELLEAQAARPLAEPAAPSPQAPIAATPSANGHAPIDEEALYQRIKVRLVREAPGVLQALLRERSVELVIEEVEPLRIDGESLKGWMARLIHEGWFDAPRSNSDVVNELGRRGRKTIAPRISEAIADVCALGFMTKESEGYKAVANMKKKIVRV